MRENINEVSRERIESNNLASMIGDAVKEGKSSNVSFCEKTRSNTLSSRSLTVYDTEKRIL